MGPSKRINRNVRNKATDGSSFVPVKTSDIIDLTSQTEKRPSNKSGCGVDKPTTTKSKSKLKRRPADDTTVIEQIRVDSLKVKHVSLQNNSKSKDDGSCFRKKVSTSSTSTPESPVKAKTSEETMHEDSFLDDDNLLPDSQFHSQENFLLDSSQDGCDQCEVKWDYTSPETMKQLKKMRGKYSAQDVKRMIANFPDIPIKPVPQPAVHQFGFALAPKTVDLLPERNSKVLKAKRKAAKRIQQRERCRGTVEDIIFLLQEKQEKARGETRSAEVSSETDIVELEKMDAPALAENSSYDDLFQDDNSFLIEATQNLEKLVPVVSKKDSIDQFTNSITNVSVKVSEASNSCDMFPSVLPNSSLENSFLSKSVIPSSYAGAMEMNLLTASTFGTNFSNKAISRSTTSSKGSVSNPSYLNNPNCGGLPSASKIETQTNVKPPMKRHNFNQQNKQKITQQGRNVCNGPNSSNATFQRQHTFHKNTSNTPGGKTSPSLNSPFRKCLSFDDSFSSSCKNRVSDNRKELLENNQKTSHNISFDTSLSDDLLLQATELFDSVCDSNADISSNFNDKDKASMNSDVPCNVGSKSFGTVCKPSKIDDLNGTLLSPVRPCQDLALKRLQHLKSSDSPVQSFFKKTFAIDHQQAAKHKSPAGPNSTSTPVKVAKIPDKGNEKQQTNKGADSFMDDDSFMNDEALFESQILPMLEQAETQMTKQESKVASNLPKYSPDEIEKKRLAALQKLRKNNPNPQLHQDAILKASTSPDIIEQTQISSSPRQCSQEEINRKKQAAQRKLMARTHSAGSIPISHSFMDPHNANNNNDKAGGNEVKCSQETIKMKREEALKKRRLKLMQLPNRNS